MASLSEATACKQTSSHIYTAHFIKQYCIGSVPHGGFISSCFLRVVQKHFATTLSAQKQPHTITAHYEFLRRTDIGPATFTVKDVKLGRQMSTVHVTLSQGSREEVVAYFTNSNLHTENGISFSTGWQLHPPASPVDIAALRAGKDERWEEQAHMPFAVFRKASQNVKFFFPKQGQPMRSIADQWMCFKNGDKFTNVDVGFVADMFPQVIESYRTGSDPYAIVPPNKASAEVETKSNGMASFWYPTVLLNLDIKKALPEEGAEFLFVRTRAKQIKNGRYDLEVIILDEGGEIVCLSHHVCMVLSAERNMAKRNTAQKL